MTIEQANEYFSSLPEGFAPAEELRAALTADVQKVQFVDFIQFNAAKDSRQPPHILTFEIGTWTELIHPKQQ